MLALGGLGRAGVVAARKSELPGASTDESTGIMERMGLTWPLTRDLDDAVQVRELERHEPGGDWMTRLVCSYLFRSLPPDNIQQLFAQLEAIRAKPGDVIVEQGAFNEFLYIVAEGTCVMTRMASGSGPERMLGVLEEGDTFGEEALLCGAQHDISLKVLSGGFLMRLPRHSFEKLVSDPAIKSVDHAQACELVRQGNVWLDVRASKAPAAKVIADSINIPLNMLRFEAAKLDRTKTYIVYADTASRCLTGALLLARQGVAVYYLSEKPQAAQEAKGSASTASETVAEPVAETLPRIEVTSHGSQVADEVSELHAQLASMRTELERATSDRRQFADSARELRQRYEETRREVQVERSKRDALEIKQALIEASAIGSVDSTDTNYEEERQTNNSRLREGERQRQRLTAQLNTFNQCLKTTTLALKEMQLGRDAACDELARECERFESQRKASEDRLLGVSSELRDTREAHKAAIGQFAKDRARFEIVLNESTARLKEATRTVHGLRQERQASVTRLEQELELLRSRLAQSEGRLEDTVSSLQEAQQERRATVKQLEQERARLDSRLAETGGRLEATASTLQEVQHERRTTVKQLEQERARLDSRLAETEGRLRENSRTSLELEREHQKTRARVSELEISLSKRLRERASLETSLRVVEASLEDVEHSVEQAASTRLVTQQARIEAEAQQLQAKFEQTRQVEPSPKRQRYAVLEGALAALHQQVGELASLREQVLRQTDSPSGYEVAGREHGTQGPEETQARKRSRDEYVGSTQPEAKLIAFPPSSRTPR